MNGRGLRRLTIVSIAVFVCIFQFGCQKEVAQDLTAAEVPRETSEAEAAPSPAAEAVPPPVAEQRPGKSFTLRKLTNLRRTSSLTLEGLVAQSAGNPMVQPFVNEAKRESHLIDRIYSLIPKDSNTTDSTPIILESKQEMCYYCIKNISVERLDVEQYEKIKAIGAYRESFAQSQNMAPVHFAPENILKRMKFRLLKQDKEDADANTPEQDKG